MSNITVQGGPINLRDFGIEASIDLEKATTVKPSQELHRKPRPVSQELVTQAINNNPLEGIPRWGFSDNTEAHTGFLQALPQVKNRFLHTHFLMLFDLGINFETSPTQTADLVTQRITEKKHLGAYLAALHTSFGAFQKMFNFVQFIAEKGRLEEKHMSSIDSICQAYSVLGGVVEGARLMSPIGLQIEFNRERYIFEIPVVLPTSNLPEILMAMPVCYYGNLQESVRELDPEVSGSTRFICDVVGSKSFAWFYQMYNRRDRSIKNFPIVDPIPSDYLEFRKQIKDMIDLELITTPYHQVASAEWSNPNWIAGIDPLAIAMFHDLPFFIIMKRWSGNGIFPLLCNLIANTIDHIQKNKSALNNFKTNTYWYKGSSRYLGEGLERFAEDLLKKFNEGKVFEYLRG